jgi:hypothetical protein
MPTPAMIGREPELATRLAEFAMGRSVTDVELPG